MPKTRIYPGLDSLVDLADAGVDIRPTLLRVLTDLYVQQPTHSLEEERQYCELAHRLIEAVDVPTRVVVAMRLGSYPAAPLEILARLRRDAGEVRAVLSAPSLERRDAASSGKAQAGERINPDSPETAELSALFAAASAEERRLILVTLDLASPETREDMRAGPSAIAALETHALQRRTEAFVRELARLLAIGDEQARWIVQDPGGEPVVAAAKALGMPSDMVQRVLLFLNPAIGHSVARVYALARLSDELSPAAACALVAIWQAAHPRAPRTASHRPTAAQTRREPTSAAARVAAYRDLPGGLRERGRIR